MVHPHAHVRPVFHVKLPEFDKDHTARFRSGLMLRLRWIPDIGPSREVAMFILKDAFEHNKLLASGMHMRREMAVWVVFNNGSCPRHFAPNPVKRSS